MRPSGCFVPFIVRVDAVEPAVHGQSKPEVIRHQVATFCAAEISQQPIRGGDRNRVPILRHWTFRVYKLPGINALQERQPIAELQRTVPCHTDDRLLFRTFDYAVLRVVELDPTADGGVEEQRSRTVRTDHAILRRIDVDVARIDIVVHPVTPRQAAGDERVVQETEKLTIRDFVDPDPKGVRGPAGLRIVALHDGHLDRQRRQADADDNASRGGCPAGDILKQNHRRMKFVDGKLHQLGRADGNDDLRVQTRRERSDVGRSAVDQYPARVGRHLPGQLLLRRIGQHVGLGIGKERTARGSG